MTSQKEVERIQARLTDVQLRIVEFAAQEAIKQVGYPYDIEVRVDVSYENFTASTKARL